jgi:hypothetical protein
MKYCLLGLLALISCADPVSEKDSAQPLTKNAAGRAEGTQKNYYEDGKIKNEVSYVDGRRDGAAKQYYTNGQAESEISYKDNVKDGPSKWYYEDGILYQEVTYRSGKKHGIEKKYHNTGKLMAELFWTDGEVLPGLKEYDYNSKLLRQPYIVVTGDKTLRLKMSNGDEKAEYYIGKLAEGQSLVGAGLQVLPKNKGEAVYTVPAGQKTVHIVVERKTALKNPQTLLLSYQIP